MDLSSLLACGEVWLTQCTFYDKICQLLADGKCFSLSSPVSPTNKTEIFLKMVPKY
jgi:hypothetical protein